ncbi:MAG: DUF4445 domain-containing protein [Chloroflexi bacterium]|nr:DUF4445 domain-containing protein [Chloroflexota bacterium]
MSSQKPLHQVVFAPEGRTVRVPHDTLLVDAAAQAGLFIDIPCGGQGRCGRCQVKVEEGLTTHGESPYLSRQQMAEGWVLSCVCRVASDLKVTVPPKRERERAVTTASRKAAAPPLDWPVSPGIHRFSVELSPPSLEDPTTDLERLTVALTRRGGFSSLEVPLPIVQQLPVTLRRGDWRVNAVVEQGPTPERARLLALHPGHEPCPLWGLAVDIGTTNVVAFLVDLESGKILGQASSLNRQVARGEDVISRIIYSLKGDGLAVLQRLVMETITSLIAELTAPRPADSAHIHSVVVAANTTMSHLFLGITPRHIREEPYVPVTNRYPVVRAGELGLPLNPNAAIYTIPSIAAYVGGDITSGALTSGIYKTPALTLFMDVGTNGEIVLGNADWLMTDACSAGPAFEGAGIRCGMRAIPGAIEDITISSKTLEPTIRTIGDEPPQGICGSGMISALSEMLITGVISRSGRLNVDSMGQRMGERSRVRRGDHGPEYVFVWAQDSGTGKDISFSEVDIDNLIRAKGAIYAGIEVMLKSAGITHDMIEQVLIGGAFGQHINIEDAIQIGLLPDLPWERFKYLGNTSLSGAYNVLLSREARAKAEEVAGKMTYLELIADNSFMNEFTAALFLPHTEIDKFPSVKVLLEQGSQ